MASILLVLGLLEGFELRLVHSPCHIITIGHTPTHTRAVYSLGGAIGNLNDTLVMLFGRCCVSCLDLHDSPVCQKAAVPCGESLRPNSLCRTWQPLLLRQMEVTSSQGRPGTARNWGRPRKSWHGPARKILARKDIGTTWYKSFFFFEGGGYF